MSLDLHARRYGAFFETLEPAGLQNLKDLCVPEVRFRDPFNNLTGVAAMIAVFERMYQDCEAPRFHVEHLAVEGKIAYLRWRFTAQAKDSRRPWHIEGVSEVHFDETGKVTAHIDHWDAAGQIYEKLPLLGALLRRIRRRLAIS